MHRFFISESAGDTVIDNQVVITDPLLIHQFVKVLRFRVGENVLIFDNSGMEFEIEIDSISNTKIMGKILQKTLNEAELPIKLLIAQSILKNPEKFEYVFQKGTELGAEAFIPLVTERTERRSLAKVDRLHRILKEAAEQSGRGVVPELHEICELKNIFKKYREDETLFLVLDPTFKEKFKDFKEKFVTKNIFVLIGPEGGFSHKELQFCAENGAYGISLGKRILRSETASSVIATMINEMLGFF